MNFTMFISARDYTPHCRNMKETSFFCIYLGIVYEKGDVFLRRKIGILGLIVLLLCAVIGSQKAGEYLYKNYMGSEGKKTAAAAKKGDKPMVVIDAGHGGRCV